MIIGHTLQLGLLKLLAPAPTVLLACATIDSAALVNPPCLPGPPLHLPWWLYAKGPDVQALFDLTSLVQLTRKLLSEAKATETSGNCSPCYQAHTCKGSALVLNSTSTHLCAGGRAGELRMGSEG